LQFSLQAASPETFGYTLVEKIRRMSGKGRNISIPGVCVDGAIIASQTDVVSALASPFSSVCSSNRYYPVFRRVKQNSERFMLKFTSRDDDRTFNVTETIPQRFTGPGWYN
jgi:hypothetical protein